MSRPKSMPDFSALMDASTPLFEARAQNRRETSPVRGQGHPRKKLSISLATGLIMNTDNTKGAGLLISPSKSSLGETREEGEENHTSNDGLFHAYALKSDYTNSPPYILTFASVAICTQWWAIVQREYPESRRPSAQLFVMRSEDLERIPENFRFHTLKHKWFFTGQDNLSNTTSVIPLQNPESTNVLPTAQPVAERPSSSSSAAIESLSEKLDKLTNIVATNAEQIQALTVAQSAGLQRMQEINETNTAQIMALAESQSKLQVLMDQNASHYIAHSNTSYQSQDHIKEIMKTTATQLKGLSKSQAQLANTCDSMMRSIENLSTSVTQMNVAPAMSDSASSLSSPALSSALSNRISPPPRKLNRKIKGVWYEYDTPVTPNASPRRSVAFVDTPPKSPAIIKKA